MAYTPYPLGDTDAENPCIAASDDGLHWYAPANINPLALTPPDGYNSDTHLVRNAANNSIECWWRPVDLTDRSDFVVRSISRDGLKWTAPDTVLNPEPGIMHHLSPAVEIVGGHYMMLYCDVNRVVMLRSKVDAPAVEWDEPVYLPIHWSHYNPWHIDMIVDGDIIEMVVCAFDAQEPGANNNAADLFYLTYNMTTGEATRPTKILSRRPGTITERSIYRSSLLKVAGRYYLYYSCIDNDWHRHMGLAVAQSLTDPDGLVFVEPNAVADVYPASMISGSLPVFYVNTADNAPVPDTKEYYTDATYWLDNMGIEGIESVGSASKPLATSIRRRGNSTWTSYNKKPFKLKLDKKASLMGMPASKHFALMAHADGQRGSNYLHDGLGFASAAAIDLGWVPAERPVELVLNGTYMGIYFLCETIRVDKTRLDIDEQDDLVTDPDVIDNGGWLVEIDNAVGDYFLMIHEKNPQQSTVFISPDTPEELSPEQRAYLVAELNRLNDAIYADDLDGNALSQVVDMESLVKYYIVQELLVNLDAFVGSTYLYRKGGDDHKWYFGPVWDFGNVSVGNDTYLNEYFYDATPYNVCWIKQIALHDEFRDAVTRAWPQYRPILLQAAEQYLDRQVKEVSPAIAADHGRWPSIYYDAAAFSQSAERLMTAIRRRAAWLDQALDFNSVESITPDGDTNLIIRSVAGNLEITADAPRSLIIAQPDGRSFTVNLHAGTNQIPLAPGIYLIAHHKIHHTN